MFTYNVSTVDGGQYCLGKCKVDSESEWEDGVGNICGYLNDESSDNKS